MSIVDIHAHLRRNSDQNLYEYEEQIQDVNKNGITVRLLSSLRGESLHMQNLAVLEFCKTHREFLPCAVLNPREESCGKELEWILATGAFPAIELDPLEHGYIPENEKKLEDIFRACGEKGIVLKLMTGHGDRTHPAQWEYYIRRYPGTRVVFLHMGGMWDGYSTIDIAKKYENVWLDTSEVFELPLFRYALRNVPVERILFGSGFPERFTECSTPIVK